MVDLVECKSLYSENWELQKTSFISPMTVPYAKLMRTGSVLLLLRFFIVFDFTLYEDTGSIAPL